MRVEIESLPRFDRHVAAEGSLAGCLVQSLDLRGRSHILESVDLRNAVFLGCRFKHRVAVSLAARGAPVCPRLPELPFDAYRAQLYTPAELYAGLEHGYPATLDARVYAWSLRERSHLLDATLARALHDHFVTASLLEALPEPGAGVGLMGGHSVPRGSVAYARAARLGHLLARAGKVVVTGGGPGAMEAANLGASLRGTDADVADACAALAAVPNYAPDIGAWAAAAFDVARRWDCTRTSVGVPTWYYGHEPPNAFATHVAKYFDNALREDVLVRLCDGGLVFAEGAAGTTQEVFQAVTRNYYALERHHLRPLVLVGRAYWSEVLPAWPLVQALARGRLMEPHVHLVDDVEEAAALLG